MKQRKFILRKHCNGVFNIIRTKSFNIPRKDYGKFVSPNRDAMKLGRALSSLKDMDEIEIKIIKRQCERIGNVDTLGKLPIKSPKT